MAGSRRAGRSSLLSWWPGPVALLLAVAVALAVPPLQGEDRTAAEPSTAAPEDSGGPPSGSPSTEPEPAGEPVGSDEQRALAEQRSREREADRQLYRPKVRPGHRIAKAEEPPPEPVEEPPPETDTGVPYRPEQEVWQAAQPAHEENPANPLAGRRWGVYGGPLEAIWAPYQASSGQQRALLEKIARRPKATWLGDWTASAERISGTIREYVAVTTGGDRDVLVQLSIFRMVPWEHAACDRAPSLAEAGSYRRWISNAAAALGDQHTALILQPDLPFWWCAPNRQLTRELIRHAVRAFSAQPNTSVYLDAGDADWSSTPQSGTPRPEQAADMLIANGIAEARGFALGATHYVGTAERIDYGARLVEILAARGVGQKRFVVDTGQNGNPMRWPEVTPVGGSIKDNARICTSPGDRNGCATLGIPPTSRVGDPRWGLPESTAAKARRHVDGYLWFSRSWLRMQADWVGPQRALDMARSTRWPGPPA